MSKLSKIEITSVQDHAREVAANRSHLANSGVALDECLSLSRDFGKDNKPNARGRRKLSIWNETLAQATKATL